MTICDRCGKNAKKLIEIKDEYGGGEVCQSCMDEIFKALTDYTSEHITPLYKKRDEYVKAVNKGFNLAE